MEHDETIKKAKVLVAATGSVATIKLVELVQLLQQKAEVKVILT
jgi:phosphopantothenoylcysteine synthetase/decarboxylase